MLILRPVCGGHCAASNTCIRSRRCSCRAHTTHCMAAPPDCSTVIPPTAQTRCVSHARRNRHGNVCPAHRGQRPAARPMPPRCHKACWEHARHRWPQRGITRSQPARRTCRCCRGALATTRAFAPVAHRCKPLAPRGVAGKPTRNPILCGTHLAGSESVHACSTHRQL